MILVENCNLSSEYDMVSDTLQISQQTNGEAENNLHKQSEKTLCLPLNGSQEDVRAVGFIGNCTYVDEESLDISGATTRETAGTSNSNTQPDVIPVCETVELLSSFHKFSLMFCPFGL